MWTNNSSKPQEKLQEDLLLPMKAIEITGSIEGSLATLDINLDYKNESETDPIECTYEFPFDKETIFSSLVAKIGDKEVVTEVRSKEKAKEIYDDAIAKGRAAVFAER